MRVSGFNSAARTPSGGSQCSSKSAIKITQQQGSAKGPLEAYPLTSANRTDNMSLMIQALILQPPVAGFCTSSFFVSIVKYRKNWNNWTWLFDVGVAFAGKVNYFLFLFCLMSRAEGPVFAVLSSPYPREGISDVLASGSIIPVLTVSYSLLKGN